MKTIRFGSSSYSLRQETFSQAEWEGWLKKSSLSSIEQSYVYGAAEAVVEGMEIRRFGIYRNETRIALAQALVKKTFLGLFKIIKLSRGPIWLSNPVLPDEKLATFMVLRKAFSRLKGEFIVLSPELEETPSQQALLQEAGFSMIATGFSSARVDLTQSKDDLKKNLRANWRNQLHKAQESGLDLQHQKLDSNIDWLLSNYEAHLKDKAFPGDSPALVRQLVEIADQNQLQLLTAFDKKEPVAAILNIVHGFCATYFIGFSSAKGRQYNATQLLLWESIMDLKKKNIRLYDLGGLYLQDLAGNESEGLTSFKQGLGGQEYQLVGTFV